MFLIDFFCYAFFFFFKQKTAYEMRISDWSSDVCSSDLDTKSAGPFCETCKCSISPKSRRSLVPALRAARSMTVMMPDRALSNLPPPACGRGPYSIRAPHIFAVIDIDHDAGAAGDVRRHHHAHAIVQDRGIGSPSCRGREWPNV